MYAYRVRRDCLKCPVLRYTGGPWKFERSTRHCMEFTMTEDKIARWNKMLLFLIKIRKYTHLAWFLLSIWPISSFLGGFQVLVAAFYRRSQSWTLLFRKTWTERPLFHRNSNSLLNFSLLVLKKRHNELGIDLLSATRLEDSVSSVSNPSLVVNSM